MKRIKNKILKILTFLSDKYGDRFLSLVIPFITIYTAYLLFFAYFIKSEPKDNLFYMTLLVIISFLSVYGILAIFKDLKEHGTFKTIRYWIDKIK